MDENEFKIAYHDVNERPCPFGKALLTRCAQCSRAQKVLIAEREAVTCLSPAAYSRCATFIPAWRSKALFALRLTHVSDKLPHGKEIKVQCGGLRGLAQAMADAAPVIDIHALLERALARFGDPDRLPYPDMMKSVVSYQPRRKKKPLT
ncbi:MAG: hypothetical protein M0R77_12070 [Gammaproteobacteria bacterium]|nr:hypothetical protein [Gammaproteobacteria bacterium]